MKRASTAVAGVAMTFGATGAALAQAETASPSLGDYQLNQLSNGNLEVVNGSQKITLKAGQFSVTDAGISVSKEVLGQIVAHLGPAVGAAAAGVGMAVGGSLLAVGTAAALSSSGGDSNTTTPANSAPVVANEIADQSATAGTALNFTLPTNVFSDADNDTLTLSATLSDGSALPSWLSFNSSTGQFTGTPPTGTSSVSIKVTASDGKGGTVSDSFDINVSATANPAAPVISSSVKSTMSVAEGASASEVTTVTVDQGSGITWSLEGVDAAKFNIDSSGKISFATALDHENGTDKNKDGTYDVTVKATNSSGSTTKDIKITVTDVAELPSWMSTASEYGIGYDASNASAPQNGVHVLLDSDADNNAGSESHWAGNGNYNKGVELTFGFVDSGGIMRPQGNSQASMDQSYTDSEKTYIRTVFSNYSDVANIKFTEVSDVQGETSADIRLGKGTASALGVPANVLGFAYQPSNAGIISPERSSDFSSTSYIGDFFLVTDSLAGQADWTVLNYNDAQNTISHELGHALGLDHPFASNGFAPITDTSNTAQNYTGDVVGGGQQSGLADSMMESIMTYYSPSATASVGGWDSTKITNWKPAIYDIAALQHLYGANMETAKGDTVYTYQGAMSNGVATGNNVTFDTIWDAGGTDTIKVDNVSSINNINMNEGTTSLIGLVPSQVYWLPSADNAGNWDGLKATIGGVEIEAALVQEGNRYGVVFDVGQLGSTPTGVIKVTNGDGSLVSTQFNGTQSVTWGTKAEGDVNFGIAFGVTIENLEVNAHGGTYVGNSAANTMTLTHTATSSTSTITGGGGGDKFVVGNSTGVTSTNFVITDFEAGSDTLTVTSGGTAVASSTLTGQASGQDYVLTHSDSALTITLQGLSSFDLSNDYLMA